MSAPLSEPSEMPTDREIQWALGLAEHATIELTAMHRATADVWAHLPLEERLAQAADLLAYAAPRIDALERAMPLLRRALGPHRAPAVD